MGSGARLSTPKEVRGSQSPHRVSTAATRLCLGLLLSVSTALLPAPSLSFPKAQGSRAVPNWATQRAIAAEHLWDGFSQYPLRPFHSGTLALPRSFLHPLFCSGDPGSVPSEGSKSLLLYRKEMFDSSPLPQFWAKLYIFKMAC